METEVYEVFEALLESHGVTAADVCRATGIKPNTISNWKKKRHKLSTALLEKIAQYFGVSVDYMITGASGEHFSVEGEGYYFSDETAQAAQRLFESRGLRVLFDAAQDESEENLLKFAAMIRAYKDAENKD